MQVLSLSGQNHTVKLLDSWGSNGGKWERLQGLRNPCKEGWVEVSIALGSIWDSECEHGWKKVSRIKKSLGLKIWDEKRSAEGKKWDIKEI